MYTYIFGFVRLMVCGTHTHKHTHTHTHTDTDTDTDTDTQTHRHTHTRYPRGLTCISAPLQGFCRKSGRIYPSSIAVPNTPDCGANCSCMSMCVCIYCIDIDIDR